MTSSGSMGVFLQRTKGFSVYKPTPPLLSWDCSRPFPRCMVASLLFSSLLFSSLLFSSLLCSALLSSPLLSSPLLSSPPFFTTLLKLRLAVLYFKVIKSNFISCSKKFLPESAIDVITTST
ncbi:hypothetical protein LDENG_00131230 [Lucifuga dentata]|nr:hypothetical protein LDENG_00131230 [Lucifuga dentata]